MGVLVAILSPPKYSLVEMLRLNAKWTKAYGRLSERSRTCNFSFMEHHRVLKESRVKIKIGAFIVIGFCMLVAFGCGGSASGASRAASQTNPGTSSSTSASTSPTMPSSSATATSGSDTASVASQTSLVASGSVTFAPTTSLAVETGNNTNLTNFNGTTNGDVKPGNISKVDLHSLLYTGCNHENICSLYAVVGRLGPRQHRPWR